MKKMIIGAFALSLMAAPALADSTIDTGSITSGDGHVGFNYSEVSVSGGNHIITTNGNYSANFGSINAGHVVNITSYTNSDIGAPSLTLPAASEAFEMPEISLYTTGTTAVGATTYYESGFSPVITLGNGIVEPLLEEEVSF
ncbi:MAG: hypothetical protein CMN55_13190 [Sneathiella sp.]|jgi:hypothetical protein|uniref:hypothetical protein n=1 Tax=Sneathiella sp. TaxID=1964365 RepID=UPI000C5E76C1|nr:hypothetical protein [Sneathiella sp.]MAL80044.1 hypothetical protein [Sneathiella sp.]|tara:strand:- start:145 stop:570 length:426 start_codon:yes stop_codon:yes gene_type:complete